MFFSQITDALYFSIASKYSARYYLVAVEEAALYPPNSTTT